MSEVNLAADYGWGPYTLLWIFLIAITIATAGFLIVMATTRARKKMTFPAKRSYHFEAFWAVGIAGVLIWLWIVSYPWMPPIAFSAIDPESEDLQVATITAGQWFWVMEVKDNSPVDPGEGPEFQEDPRTEIVAGKPVKFVAHSEDVNHGFGIFNGKEDGAPILLQMQVIPDEENVFYYTFDEPGTYLIRCLEYCGYLHPYMTSTITVVPGDSA